MNESQLYEVKSNDYFDSVRRDISSLLPRKINRLLEVGCGSGNIGSGFAGLGLRGSSVS